MKKRQSSKETDMEKDDERETSFNLSLLIDDIGVVAACDCHFQTAGPMTGILTIPELQVKEQLVNDLCGLPENYGVFRVWRVLFCMHECSVFMCSMCSVMAACSSGKSFVLAPMQACVHMYKRVKKQGINICASVFVCVCMSQCVCMWMNAQQGFS